MNYLKHFPIAVIVALSACGGGGGGGGSFSSLLTPAQQENVTTASFARLAASNSQTANVSISSALGTLSNLINGNSVLASNTAVNTSALAAQTAVTLAVTAQNNAAAAAADLSIASNVTIAGVVSNGRSICSAANSCTAAEISTLSYRAAEAAKTAAEASLYAITATNQLKSVIVSLAPSLNVSAATDAIATALTSATSAQTNANQSISNYKTASVNIGIQVPTISLSSGTTGSVAGAPTYSGNTQTIVTTYANGQTSTATNTATGSTVSWGSDNVTRTTTYTYANGGTNTVIDTVPGTVSVTYSGGTQTITTTFGNGSTKGAYLEATGSTVSWGSDNVTRTTTYTYANGRSNSVVDTVPGTAGAPTYSGNTQTIVTTYANGQTSTTTNTATSSTVNWGSDNVTRTTTYTFANGGTNRVVETVPGVAATPTYSGNTQTIVTTYANGQTSTTTNTATSSTVNWGSDNVTRTTTYTFANGGTNRVVETVPGVAATPTYSGNTQTIVTTYANGQTSTTTNTATSSTVNWGSDNVTRTTTYKYANGGTNSVVDTIQPTVSLPVFTAAVYPSNWTNAGINVTKPSVTAVTTTYGNGTIITENGTVGAPFKQSSLSAQSITDPNAVVKSGTTDYDLSWGTPDKNGPTYASAFDGGSYTFASNFQNMGHTVSGQCLLGPVAGFCLNGLTIGAPHPEVLDAWNKGWTGKSQSILMIDGYSATNTGFIQGADQHGITTMMLANRYAIGSTMYGLDLSLNNLGTSPTGDIRNFDGTQASSVGSSINFGVINTSFGSNYSALVGRTGSNVTSADVTTVFNQTQTYANTWAGLLDGSATLGAKWKLTDAVITKSAGNDSLASDKESFVKTYADNKSIQPRLLIVGALDRAGSVDSKATIASYSNTAGVDSAVASRFIVASGTVPFPSGALAIDGMPVLVTDNVGTSYAAPRVAGYVAILRDKFPNLDAVKSSSIILDTARYDTLTCHPNCDGSIYGKGEASLSRALAPVGKLR